MSWYQLLYGGVLIGDELVVPISSWQASAKIGSSGAGGGLEPILTVDDRPLGLVLYPRFRVRKKTEDVFEFEQWLFDLAGWANGDPRSLVVTDDADQTKAEYGFCKLFSLDRPSPSDTLVGRWSDQVIVTFQSDTMPQFYDLD